MASCVTSPGFNFDNCRRNEFLVKNGYVPPRARKTGTTIVGIIFKDGVILGADTRATEGPIVADKNCSKIHYIAQNMYCCGAGTAADTEMTTKLIASQIELLRLHMDRDARVTTAVTRLKRLLFRYQGHIGAHLVLGGIDYTGPYIYSVAAHGSTDKVPYVTMGSGCLAAMAVFESRWKQDMSEKEGMLLVRDAIAAGIFNDLGSGSNVDLCVIKKDGVQNHRTYEEANLKGVRQGDYKFPKGTTAVLSTKVTPIEITKTVVKKIDSDVEPMST